MGLRPRRRYDGLGLRRIWASSHDLLIIILAVIIAAVVWFARTIAPSGMHQSYPQRSPGLDVLEERYARGEINREEYLQKKQDITP